MEQSGPVQACDGIALPLPLPYLVSLHNILFVWGIENPHAIV